jgi:hypothetical protein
MAKGSPPEVRIRLLSFGPVREMVSSSTTTMTPFRPFASIQYSTLSPLSPTLILVFGSQMAPLLLRPSLMLEVAAPTGLQMVNYLLLVSSMVMFSSEIKLVTMS